MSKPHFHLLKGFALGVEIQPLYGMDVPEKDEDFPPFILDILGVHIYLGVLKLVWYIDTPFKETIR